MSLKQNKNISSLLSFTFGNGLYYVYNPLPNVNDNKLEIFLFCFKDIVKEFVYVSRSNIPVALLWFSVGVMFLHI